MPELGSAYFTLETKSTEFQAGVEKAEMAAKQATTAIAEQFGMVDAAVAESGTVAMRTGAEYQAAGKSMATGMETGAATAIASSQKAATAAAAAAAKIKMTWTKTKAAGMAVFGAGMLVTGVKMLTDSVLEEGRAQLKTAAAFGITQEEAARLNDTLDFVGSTTDAVIPVMARLTKSAGDAGSTGAEAMEKWGISTKDFLNADVAGKMTMLADGMKMAGERSDEFLSTVLGGRGMKLAPVLMQWGDALAATTGDKNPIIDAAQMRALSEFQDDLNDLIVTIKVPLMNAIVALKVPLVAVTALFVAVKVGKAFTEMATNIKIAAQAVSAYTAKLITWIAVRQGATVAEVEGTVATEASATATTAAGVASLSASIGLKAMAVAAGTLLVVVASVGLALKAVYDVWKLIHLDEKLAKEWGATNSKAITDSSNRVEALGAQWAKVQEFQAAAIPQPVDMSLPIVPRATGRSGISDHTDEVGDAEAATAMFNETVENQVAELEKMPGILDAAQAALIRERVASGDTQTAVNLLGQAEQRFMDTLDQSKHHVDEAGARVRNFGRMTKGALDDVAAAFTETTASVIPAIDDLTGHFWTSSKKIVRGLHHQMAVLARWKTDTNKVLNDVGLSETQKATLLAQPAEIVDAWVHGTKQQKQQIMHGIGDVESLTRTTTSSVEGALAGAHEVAGAIDVASGSLSRFNEGLAQLREGINAPFIIHLQVDKTGHKAGGGPVSAGMPYTVGERGRELFVPDTGGTIITHNALTNIERGGGGGSSPVVTRLRIEDWETGMATIEVMARDAARDETGQDGARTRARRLA